jgi:hypothetical protein
MRFGLKAASTWSQSRTSGIVEYDYEDTLNVPADHQKKTCFSTKSGLVREVITYHKREHTHVFINFERKLLHSRLFQRRGLGKLGFTPFNFEITGSRRYASSS